MRLQALVVAFAVVLLASCHDRNSHNTDGEKRKDQAMPAAEAGTSCEGTDADTLDSESHSKYYTTYTDTAEVTNLRIFARKQKVIYNPALLVGEWRCGNKYEEYLADNNGLYWDTDDDVCRKEAPHFQWTMDDNLLKLTYKMAVNGFVTRYFVVTYVDDETLVYRDDYGVSYMWDKVPEHDDM